ncbi:MAG: substrate-binding domain-containing protein, partial [Deinococcales bacterium]
MTRFVRCVVVTLALVLVASAGAQTVRVFAASSLTDAFTALAQSYEATHPGVHIALDFAASSTLATQILQGA